MSEEMRMTVELPRDMTGAEIAKAVEIAADRFECGLVEIMSDDGELIEIGTHSQWPEKRFLITPDDAHHQFGREAVYSENIHLSIYQPGPGPIVVFANSPELELQAFSSVLSTTLSEVVEA